VTRGAKAPIRLPRQGLLGLVKARPSPPLAIGWCPHCNKNVSATEAKALFDETLRVLSISGSMQRVKQAYMHTVCNSILLDPREKAA
jgi:hypothetical protein